MFTAAFSLAVTPFAPYSAAVSEGTMNGSGFIQRALTSAEIETICNQALDAWKTAAKRVLVIVPDHSRTCPLNAIFRLLYARLAPERPHLDFLIALGTHPPMSERLIYERFGITADEHRARYPKARFFNHEWKNHAQLAQAGRLTKHDVREITGGLFEMDVTITCNRMVYDYDMLLIVGPVFPHEVVGFSGGNKYLFPGIAGQEIIDFFHWLGAVITNPVIIGNKWTPVRKVVDRAAAFLPVERQALCLVVKGESLAGLYAGAPEEAWSAAADLSRQIHIEYRDRPYRTVLSCAPRMYDDLWTGGKCMYKIEPVVADGGRVIVYAPHIAEISAVHGRVLEKIGYHTRDFFLKQWDAYRHYPWGVVAHSTHVKGIGTYENGVERPRVEVILATGIPEAVCRQVNLGYLDPRGVKQSEYEGREAEGILCVPKAGEILYRWRGAPPELGGGTEKN
jgi:nickel-dependent lactate racemase